MLAQFDAAGLRPGAVRRRVHAIDPGGGQRQYRPALDSGTVRHSSSTAQSDGRRRREAWTAAWLAWRGPQRRLASLPWLFPAIMVAVVFTTGNHYVLDAVGSTVLLAISIVLADWVEPVPSSPASFADPDGSSARSRGDHRGQEE